MSLTHLSPESTFGIQQNRTQTHNKCVHDSMKLANWFSSPCRMSLHYIWYPMDPPPSGNCSGNLPVGTVFDPSITSVYFCNSAQLGKLTTNVSMTQ